MNILICDDMKSETEKLERLFSGLGFEIKTVTFHNGYDALDYIHTGAVVDACFLDIIMPEMGGVALAGSLRASGYKGEIIFLTTSNEFAAESYKVKAFSYLLKPPKPEEVREILHSLVNTKKMGDVDGLLIKIGKMARFLLFRDISHVEVIRHYVYFHLIDGEEIKIYTTLGEIAARLLEDERFTPCHRSYIVNMSEITAIDESEITMRSGKKIPNSKSYSDVKKKFAKWMLGGIKK